MFWTVSDTHNNETKLISHCELEPNCLNGGIRLWLPLISNSASKMQQWVPTETTDFMEL